MAENVVVAKGSLAFSTFDNNLLREFRNGKLCCPMICVEYEAEGYCIVDKGNPVSVAFYKAPDGLDHHIRTMHQKELTDEHQMIAKGLSIKFVGSETLKNIKAFSAARQEDKSFDYVTCKVNLSSSDSGTEEKGGSASDSQELEELVFNSKREKEAAKFFCLYLQHIGKLKNIEDRNNPCVVSVKSKRMHIKYLAWNSTSKIHLETCYCKLVSICPENSLSHSLIIIYDTCFVAGKIIVSEQSPGYYVYNM